MSAASDQKRLQAAAAPGYRRRDRLLEALLTHSRSECGRLRREPIDLAATTEDLLRTSPQYWQSVVPGST